VARASAFVAIDLSCIVVMFVSIAMRDLLIKLYEMTEIGDLFAHAARSLCEDGKRATAKYNKPVHRQCFDDCRNWHAFFLGMVGH
jgi:hypothetical protein